MKKLLPLALALAGCSSPSGVKVIVGAKLGSIDYSVVVIEAGKIAAAGFFGESWQLQASDGK